MVFKPRPEVEEESPGKKKKKKKKKPHGSTDMGPQGPSPEGTVGVSQILVQGVGRQALSVCACRRWRWRRRVYRSTGLTMGSRSKVGPSLELISHWLATLMQRLFLRGAARAPNRAVDQRSLGASAGFLPLPESAVEPCQHHPQTRQAATAGAPPGAAEATGGGTALTQDYSLLPTYVTCACHHGQYRHLRSEALRQEEVLALALPPEPGAYDRWDFATRALKVRREPKTKGGSPCLLRRGCGRLYSQNLNMSSVSVLWQRSKQPWACPFTFGLGTGGGRRGPGEVPPLCEVWGQVLLPRLLARLKPSRLATHHVRKAHRRGPISPKAGTGTEPRPSHGGR
jgi:hypothetical protein